MSAVTKKTALLATVLILIWAVPAGAQPRRGRIVVVPRGHFYAPFFYDPFWGPYYPYGAYPYGAYPYGAYMYGVGPEASVRVHVTPKQAEVYVDGYYAGVADDFDGVFKRLHTTPGGHAITLHLEGYRTVTQNIYVRPDSTFKLDDTMERLASGELSSPVPRPVRPPVRSGARPPEGSSAP